LGKDYLSIKVGTYLKKLKFTENTTTFKKLLRKYITECVN